MVNVVDEVTKLVAALATERHERRGVERRHGELQKEVDRLIQRNAELQVELQKAPKQDDVMGNQMSALKAELEGERRLRLDAQNLAHNLTYANDGLKKQCERLKTDHRAVSSPQGGPAGLATELAMAQGALDTVRRERNGLVERLAKEERTAINRLNSINVLEGAHRALAKENADLKQENRRALEGAESIIQKLKRERGEAELRAFEAKQENERLKAELAKATAPMCSTWDPNDKKQIEALKGECESLRNRLGLAERSAVRRAEECEKLRLAEAQRNNLRDLCDTVLAENKKLRDEAGFNEMPF